MSQERDTHFAGFADLVAQEIGKNVNIIFDTAFWPEEYYLEAISKIIAQRAQEFTLQGTPRYTVGEHIYGFNFVTGELRGRIVEVKPCLVFAYVLEGGAELGPYDDIYGRCDEQGERIR